MAQEIERKFLTRNQNWRRLAAPLLYRQGYIYTTPEQQVQVRPGEAASIVITTLGDSYVLAIPPPSAAELIEHICGPSPAYAIDTHKGYTVRVRVVGDRSYLTIKTKTVGISRSEYEFPIPLEAAAQLLERVCDRPLIEKYRYRIADTGVVWEVDEFLGDNQGLVLAEVELASETQSLTLPDWIGPEVSGDPRYFNSYLAKHPYCQWMG
jgi:CYTH domain-containing protein